MPAMPSSSSKSFSSQESSVTLCQLLWACLLSDSSWGGSSVNLPLRPRPWRQPSVFGPYFNCISESISSYALMVVLQSAIIHHDLPMFKLSCYKFALYFSSCSSSVFCSIPFWCLRLMTHPTLIFCCCHLPMRLSCRRIKNLQLKDTSLSMCKRVCHVLPKVRTLHNTIVRQELLHKRR